MNMQLWVTAAGAILGILLGFMVSIYLLKGFDPKRRKRKKKRNKKGKKKIPSIETRDIERHGLSERIIDKSESWTDITCSLEEEDSSDYIERSRKREGEAYRFVKKIKGVDHE